jgi:S-(hydroxymethyl)glutathione dehydrogenase/alcohol dehydrogenase
VVQAAVLRAAGEPMRVEDIDIAGPGPGQVRVALAATGVCHSDLSLARGRLRQSLPAVLGHEGAGTVTAVGADVTGVSPGQRVVLCWAPPCRECWFCTHGDPHLCERAADRAAQPYATATDGASVYPGLSTGAFAAETVVPAAAVHPLPDDVPLEHAALLGCAVLTGVGAVRNTARVQPGESVVVVGVGGVGLSVVQGARITGAATIVAVDRSAEKLELAGRCGADTTMVSGDDLVKQVRRHTAGRGADHVFDCVGTAATIRTSWSLSRRGGHVTIVGIGAKDDMVSFSALELFHFARTISGCVYGSMDPDRDIPFLLEQARTGALDLGALITKRITLADVDAAFAEMESGVGARSLVVF